MSNLNATYLTHAGAAEEALAKQEGRKVQIVKVVVGTGQLAVELDPRDQTALISQIAETAAFTHIGKVAGEFKVDGDLAIPDVGYNYWEIGTITDTGVLYTYTRAIGDYVPGKDDSISKVTRPRLYFKTQNADVVTITEDKTPQYVVVPDFDAHVEEYQAYVQTTNTAISERERVNNSATDADIDVGSSAQKHVKLPQFWRGIEAKLSVLDSHLGYLKSRVYSFDVGDDFGWVKLASVLGGSNGLKIGFDLSNHVSHYGNQSLDITLNGRPTSIAGIIFQNKGSKVYGVYIVELPKVSGHPSYDVWCYLDQFAVGQVSMCTLGSDSRVTFYDDKTLKEDAPILPEGARVVFDSRHVVSGEYIARAEAIFPILTEDNSDCLPGVPLPWPSNILPSGWLECRGQTFNKELYPRLAIAYPNGALPDMRASFIRGLDNGRGIDVGRTILSSQSDAIRNITGSYTVIKGSEGVAEQSGAFKDSYHESVSASGHAASTQNGIMHVNFDASDSVPTASDNRPLNTAFMFIVKAA